MMDSKNVRMAVLLTTHNRCQTTLDCLQKLLSQELTPAVKITTYLVDDGSTDGTAEAVRHHYPFVKILVGNGHLFWNRGMHLAFGEALKQDYDYYLWLNNDTMLFPDALDNLLVNAQKLMSQGHSNAILVGSTCDPETKIHTYGGVIHNSFWHPFKFKWIKPTDQLEPCDTMNGNCVLIPRQVVQTVGNLDPSFTHGIGDFDYGLRAKQQGCTIWIIPGYIGTCSRNSVKNTVRDSSLGLFKRWRKFLHDPKGRPLNDWRILAKRYGGFFWPVFWLSSYFKFFITSLFDSIKNLVIK